MKFSSLLILFLLSFVVVSFLQIELVKAQGTIYIRSDGSVEGTDNISRDGNVYTFIGNIFGSIVVEKDDVIIYGGGFILEGDGSGRGLDFVDDVTNITVKNLQIRFFDVGIHLSNCSHALIESNFILNNYEGIRINGGFNNSIINNRIENSSNNGISVFFNTRQNQISENTITNNWVGVLFHLYSEGNTLSNNIITENRGIGVWLDGGSNNKIVQNNITDNTIGVFSTRPINSTVHHNNFVNNTFQVDIYGNDPVIGTWDNGSEGNYWDTYTGTDNNGDGIGDTPYIINENNQDNYPLMNIVEIPEFPSWSIISIVFTLTLVILIFKTKLKKKVLE